MVKAVLYTHSNGFLMAFDPLMKWPVQSVPVTVWVHFLTGYSWYIYVPVPVWVHFLTRYNVSVSRQTGTLQSTVQRVNESKLPTQPQPIM